MARANTRTLLSLDRFAQIVGLHPLHFNQVSLAEEGSTEDPASCGKIIVQHPWQAHDAMAREEIARCLAVAEANIAMYLGYDVMPTWNRMDLVDAPTPRGPRYEYNHLLTTSKGYVLSGGIEGKALVALAQQVVYSDNDGDGYFETATISTATTVTDPQEIAIYYPGRAGSNLWEIRPTTVTISGGVATIVCRREQLVVPELLEVVRGELQPAAYDLDDDFLDTVDVYRHYNDPATQARFIWEAGSGPCGACVGSGCASCSYHIQSACMMVRNRRLGHIVLSAADWDTDTLAFTGHVGPNHYIGTSPNRALLWYRAGYYNPDLARPFLDMDARFERAVVMYALSLMDRDICGCAGVNSMHEQARVDLAAVESNPNSSTSYNAEEGYLDSRFGTRAGAVEAWRLVETMALGRAAVHG